MTPTGSDVVRRITQSARTTVEQGLYQLQFQAMSTVCQIKCHGAPAPAIREFQQAAVAWVAQFEARYSRFLPDNLIGRINAAAAVTGTVNVIAGGTLVVNTSLNLGLNPGATVVATATLNITNGNVLANTISVLNSGRVNSTINLLGGSLVISNTAGSRTAPLNVLNLGGGTLHLNLNPAAGVTNIIASTVTASATTTLVLDSITSVAFSKAYPLISYNGSDPAARLGLGALPAGYTGTLVDDAADKLISVRFNPLPPALTSLTTTGGSLLFSGTGSANAGFSVRSTNNLTIPVASWPVIGTGTINSAGLFNYTQPFNPATPAAFFLFSSP